MPIVALHTNRPIPCLYEEPRGGVEPSSTAFNFDNFNYILMIVFHLGSNWKERPLPCSGITAVVPVKAAGGHGEAPVSSRCPMALLPHDHKLTLKGILPPPPPPPPHDYLKMFSSAAAKG